MTARRSSRGRDSRTSRFTATPPPTPAGRAARWRGGRAGAARRRGCRRHATAMTGQPSAPRPASTWSRSSRRIRQARSASRGSTPSGTRGLASGGRVSTTTTGSPRWTRLAVAVTMAAPSIGENTKTTLPPRTRSWSRSAIPSGSSPARTPASRSNSARRCRVPGAVAEQRHRPRRRCAGPPGRRRGCGARRPRPRPGRSGRGCSASPSRPSELPWSPSASTTSRTPLSSSAGEVVTCSSRLRTETRQLIRRSRSPGRNGRMSANSTPAPEPRRAVDADQADRPGVSARESNRARVRQHPQTVAVQADRPPAVAGPGGGQADLLLAQHPPAPPCAARSRSWAGRPRGPAARPVGGCSATYGVARHHARDVLDVLAVADREPRGGALALVQPAVVELGVEHRGRVGAVQQSEAGDQDERRTQHHHGRRGADHRGDHGDGPDDDRAGQRRGGPPTRGHPVLTASRACDGVGTWTSTASTMERPVVCVIQSSGRTVTRCESTARATAFTSSGMT